MAKLSRKMYISVLVFALIFLALGATTFAWFTLSELIQLSNVNMTVSGGSEITISLEENGEYSDKISGELLKEKIGNIRLGNLTSIDGKNLYELNDDFSLSKVNFKNYGTNKFIQVTFYFRVVPENFEGSPEMGVYLSDYNNFAKFNEEIEQRGTFVISKGVNFTTDTTYYSIDLKEDGTNIYKPGEVTKHYASDAIMVSFEDNANGNILLYDFNSKEGHNYNDGYNNDINELKGAASYYFEKTSKNPGVGENRISPIGDWAKFEDTRNPEIVTNMPNIKICSLKESNTEKGVYYGSTTVRIWIEGYDADCFNAILNDQILVQFSFRFGFINDNK